MKKILSVLIISAAIFAFFMLTASPSFADAGETIITAGDYLKEKILPVVVAVLSALGAVYVAVLPVISGVKQASAKFQGAAADVSTSNKNNIESRKMIESCTKQMETISHRNDIELEKIKAALIIGFGNCDELVEKGYAGKIAELLDDRSDEAFNRRIEARKVKKGESDRI